MQLCQAELVGPVDDDGVGAGHVDAGFDDGGTDQHIEAPVIEVAHHRFQFPLAHLPVGNADAGVRDQFADVGRGPVHGVDIVVQIVHLTATKQLAEQGFFDGGVVVLLHEGFYRQAFLRWGGDDGNVAHAAKGHIQGTGDRSGGEGEDVAFCAHLFEALLVTHPEAVFLVHDDQPQVAEGDGFLQQLVGADQDIHLAFLQTLQHLGLVLGTAEA